MRGEESPGDAVLPQPNVADGGTPFVPLCIDLDGAASVFTSPTGTFTAGLSAVWSPAPPPAIATGTNGQVSPADLSSTRTPTSFAAQSSRYPSALILEYGSSIANFTINGLEIDDSYQAASATANLGNGSLGQLTIDAVDSIRIAAPVAGAGLATVANVTGAGLALLDTGWEFPDWVMCDGVPYILAESGMASIKVDGVVEPYE
jgi:hypothetical protein